MFLLPSSFLINLLTSFLRDGSSAHWFHYTSNKQTKPSLHPLINNLSQHLSSSAHVREPGRVQSHWSTSKQDLWYTPSIASLPKRIVDISAWCLWTKTRADLITSQWQHMLFFLFERNNFLAICWHKILCYRTIERDTPSRIQPSIQISWLGLAPTICFDWFVAWNVRFHFLCCQITLWLLICHVCPITAPNLFAVPHVQWCKYRCT